MNAKAPPRPQRAQQQVVQEHTELLPELLGWQQY
jgi:hypothetical protein